MERFLLNWVMNERSHRLSVICLLFTFLIFARTEWIVLAFTVMQLKREIDLCKKHIPEELASIQPQQLTGMPHGTTVSSPTERSGILLASGWQPEYLSAMEADLKSLEEEFSERQFTVLFVSSWLQGLTDRERWIVEHQVIDGEYWKDVATAYRSAYSDECSKDSLKRLKQRAMDKIYCMAE